MGDLDPFGKESRLLHAVHAVSDGTRKKYKAALKLFRQWIVKYKTILRQVCPKMDVDEVMMRYFNYLFVRRKPQYLAVNCFHGIRHFDPRLQNSLPLAFRTLKAWKKQKPPAARPVMPREVVLMMAMTARLCYQDNDFAVLLLLAFHCYLRCSEIVALRPCDLVDLRGQLYVKIPKSKTGADQGVVVSDQALAALARTLRSKRSHAERLYHGGSAQHFRLTFYRLLETLRLTQLGLTPHSMRHGGATYDFHFLHRNVEDVLQKGRWRSTTSARHYIQSLPGLLAKVVVPVSYVRCAKRYDADLAKAFAF